MAKHELVGHSPEWGPLLKGPRGGTYAMLSGHKYYLSAEEMARAQQHIQKPASQPAEPKKEQHQPAHHEKQQLEKHEHAEKKPAELHEHDKRTIAELTKALPAPPELKSSDLPKASAADMEHRIAALSKGERSALEAYASGSGFDTSFRQLQRGASPEDIAAHREKSAGPGKDFTGLTPQQHAAAAEKMLEGFDRATEAMMQTSPTGGASVFRGMTVSQEKLHELLTNDRFHHNGTSTSTTLDPDQARGFAQEQKAMKGGAHAERKGAGVLLAYRKVPRGAPISSKKLTDFTEEKEVLLPKDQAFRVASRAYDQKRKVYVIELEPE